MSLISVIVPVYKVEPYLRECVDSILNQTFKDFELILVDDGSPDNCPAICDEYAKKDNRVMVIHKENGGLSSARNAGLSYVFTNSNSEYISFIDSDDYVDNNLFFETINLFKHGVDAVRFSYQKVYSDGKYDKPFCIEEKIFTFSTPCEKEDFLTNILLKYKIGWEAWCFVFKRSIIKSNQLLFKNNQEIFAEDIYFACKYVLHSSSLYVINKDYYKYRQREGSIMLSLKDYKINEMNNLAYALSKDDYVINNLLDIFYKIWFLIVDNRLVWVQSILSKKGITEWTKVRNGIDNKPFFVDNCKKYRKYYFRNKIKHLIDEKYILLFHLSTGNYFITRCYSIMYVTLRKLKRIFTSLCH